MDAVTGKPALRVRRSSRVLLINAEGRVLLFRFAPDHGALNGRTWWATVGGEVDAGETFEQGAVRELEEETGLVVSSVGPEIWRQSFEMEMFGGERVQADERFFRVDVETLDLVDSGWTDLERRVMTEYRWWSREDILTTSERVYPEGLADLIMRST